MEDFRVKNSLANGGFYESCSKSSFDTISSADASESVCKRVNDNTRQIIEQRMGRKQRDFFYLTEGISILRIIFIRFITITTIIDGCQGH